MASENITCAFRSAETVVRIGAGRSPFERRLLDNYGRASSAMKAVILAYAATIPMRPKGFRIDESNDN